MVLGVQTLIVDAFARVSLAAAKPVILRYLEQITGGVSLPHMRTSPCCRMASIITVFLQAIIVLVMWSGPSATLDL